MRRARLDGVVATTGQGDLPFIPALAKQYCIHCGFPFRAGDQHPDHCREYDLYPNHGRCEKRQRNAEDPEGLRMRLKKTQEADPYSKRTSPDAIAHRWVREHYPSINLQDWEPSQT